METQQPGKAASSQAAQGAAAAALQAAEARADQSERELGEVMTQVGAVLRRRKEDEVKMRDLEQQLTLASERDAGVPDQGWKEQAAVLEQAVMDAEKRAAVAGAEVERNVAQLAATEVELTREREERSSTRGMAEVGEAASAALLSELRSEQVARSAADDEVSRLKDELSQLRDQETEELAALRQRIEQEQATVSELQATLSTAEEKVLKVVEETAQAVMVARAEEAASAVVSARRDFVGESEEATAKAVAAERGRLQALHADITEAAQSEIEELRRKSEAQTLQEREAVGMWEAQEAALLQRLDDAETDLAEVTQAYPLALEEATNQLVEGHARELEKFRNAPRPEPEPDMTQVDALQAEIAQLNHAMQDRAKQEKAAVGMWAQQEATLAKQLSAAEKKAELAMAERNRLEGMHEVREEHFASEIEKLKVDAQAQRAQEKEAVDAWEVQEASLLRQLEDAENDLAELTQAYPLALEEAKISLQEAHAREMEAATGVSAMVSAEPAPIAEIMGGDGELEELRQEVEELYAMDEQRCEQVRTLEQAARDTRQDLDTVRAEYASLQTKHIEVESELPSAVSAKDEAIAAMSEELVRANAELARVTAAADATAVALEGKEERLKSLQDSLDAAQKEAAGLSASHRAAMDDAEAAHAQAVQQADTAHAAELAALREAHTVEVAELRVEIGRELADVAEAAETELKRAHKQEIEEVSDYVF